jgi:hypothetical protein
VFEAILSSISDSSYRYDRRQSSQCKIDPRSLHRLTLLQDIAGANNANKHASAGQKWSSILLKTGVYNAEDGEPAHKPTTISNDVLEGVLWALKREGISI